MAAITFQGNPVNIKGNFPAAGNAAPDFTLVATDLSEKKLSDYSGQKVVLNIFPSLDTPVCAASVRRFNEEASKMDNTVVLCISVDLPFAQARFCGAEGLDKVIPLSAFRCSAFGESYGVVIADGPLAGIFSRAVLVLDESGKVVFGEHVSEITNEPDYEAALKAL